MEENKQIITLLLETAKLGKETGGLTTGDIHRLTNKVLAVFQTYQAQDRERIARALEKEKKEYLWQAFDDDTGEVTLHERGEARPFDSGCTTQETYNAALDKALAIVQGTEEEGAK